jgi:hypothetical protein
VVVKRADIGEKSVVEGYQVGDAGNSVSVLTSGNSPKIDGYR